MGPEGEFNTGRATFHFSSTLAGSTFECAIDMGQFFACDNPHVVTGLPDGEHTFEVRAVKQHGTVKIVDTTPELWEWTVENQLPDTQIVSGPANPTTSFGGTFRFTSPDPTVGEFECALDGGLFDDCVPIQHPIPIPDSHILEEPVGPGLHTLRVRALDGEGLFDPTPASYTWRVVLAPRDEHHGRPADRDERTRPRRSRSARRPASATSARSTTRRSRPARRPRSSAASPSAGTRFSVRAIDEHGFVDATPASASWTVTHPAETIPPVTTILSGPAPAPGGVTASTVATFRFEASELGTTWDCSLDGGPYSFCMPGKTYSGLDLGEPHVQPVRDRRRRERRGHARHLHAGRSSTAPPRRPRRSSRGHRPP